MLKDKYALITGASKGIGKEIAETFAANGANVVLLGRNLDQLNETRKQIVEKYNVICEIYHCDIKIDADLASVFADLKSKGIKVNILVNNAGVMIDAPLMMVKNDTIEANIETNLIAAIKVTKYAMKSMVAARNGSIINISSIVGRFGSAGQSVYSASKSGLIGFSKSLSKELAPLNIRVNVLAPGFIETDLTKDLSDKVKEKTLSNIGMRRFGQSKDVANAALFLASDLSVYITNQIIGVDGGMVI